MPAPPSFRNFLPTASIHDVPPGWVLRVRAGGRFVAIANCGGTFVALDHSCSHAGGPIGDNRLREGCLIECPWHNAVFDARTGEVRRGPARKPLRTYEVKIEDGVIFVALDRREDEPAASETDD